jgi:hypothetical protein
MAELLCNVVYKYSGEDFPGKRLKKLLEMMFMDGRNSIVEMLNPHYDEWNAAYGKEVTGDDDMEYLHYIQTKQQAIIDKYNRISAFRNTMQFYSDEYADIAAKFYYHGKIVTMHMGIKLLNEEEWRAANN